MDVVTVMIVEGEDEEGERGVIWEKLLDCARGDQGENFDGQWKGKSRGSFDFACIRDLGPVECLVYAFNTKCSTVSRQPAS